MQESIVFLLRVQCRRKESSRSLSHLLMSLLLFLVPVYLFYDMYIKLISSFLIIIGLRILTNYLPIIVKKLLTIKIVFKY